MTAPAAAVRSVRRPAIVKAGVRVGAIGLALAAVTMGRWRATVDGGDALVIGLAFGIVLCAIAVAAGERPTIPSLGTIAIGVAGGAVLVALAVVVSAGGPPHLFGLAAPFGPWAAITIVVAVGEEAILRGALFDAIDEAGGLLAAIVITSLAFALIHVPLYGWHVVPLDLGVGVWFAGLRLVSGRVAAPAIAHAIADLATWWL
jgi:membrane protease YdiL (CAAX protease family)